MKERELNLILLTLLFLGSVSFSLAQVSSVHKESYEKGKVEAMESLRNEKFVFKAWGLPSFKLYSWESADEIYNRILKEKYKITFEWVGGCMVDEETAEYVEGYNEILEAGIEVKYGVGILEKVRKQADEEYEVKYGEKEREFNRKFKEGIKSLPKTPQLLELINIRPLSKKPQN